MTLALTDAVADDAEDTVHIVARSLARKYRGYVDRDDIVQELRVWCYEHPHKLMEWLDRDEPPERRRGLSALSKTLFRRGERFCRRQKGALLGYDPKEDEYFYSAAQIRELLGDWLQGWTDHGQPEHPKSSNKGDPAEGGNTLATFGDLADAWRCLSEDYRIVLFLLYGEVFDTRQQALKRAADRLGCSTRTVANRESAALRRMVDLLGGETPY